MNQFLLFSEDAHQLLLPLSSVFRVTPWTPPVPLPFVPPYIQGMIHVEGVLWIVVILSRLLGNPESEPCRELVLTRAGECRLAFGAHRVRDILTIQPGQREEHAMPGLPESCINFSITHEGGPAFCLKPETFVKTFQVM